MMVSPFIPTISLVKYWYVSTICLGKSKGIVEGVTTKVKVGTCVLKAGSNVGVTSGRLGLLSLVGVF